MGRTGASGAPPGSAPNGECRRPAHSARADIHGEDVETAAVGHAENDFVDAERAAPLDDLFEGGHGGFTTIKTEALGAGIAFF